MQGEAVRLALLNSPALQAMLAQSWADASRAAQTGRMSNPMLTLERTQLVDELEIGRLLSFGLLDLLTLPQRTQVAQSLMHQQQLRLTTQVIDQITQVRQAWVKAVAAQQSLTYAAQVNEAALASSELARRMQAVGNFSKLQRARQQAFTQTLPPNGPLHSTLPPPPARSWFACWGCLKHRQTLWCCLAACLTCLQHHVWQAKLANRPQLGDWTFAWPKPSLKPRPKPRASRR